ncbi:MAG: glycosyltransferase family 4 protein [Planctomycetota bacterium]
MAEERHWLRLMEEINMPRAEDRDAANAGITPPRSVRKVAIVLNSDSDAWRTRKGLVRGLTARGIQVTVVTPEGAYASRFAALGAKHVAVPMSRFVSPLRDFKLFLDLYRVFRRETPDIVHTMTIKPNIFGALAARAACVPRVVALVNGLGYSFSESGDWKRRVLQRIVSQLYRRAFRTHASVWFQNVEDMSLFTGRGFIRRDKAVLIRGSGVDLQEYSPGRVHADSSHRLRAELGIDASTHVVMMVARVTWSKGVRLFVEASQCAARWDPKTLFVLAGPLEPGCPDPVPETYLRSKTSPNFKWLGFREDVRELLALADVAVLPSYYREGVPRFLLEALAMRKPIVTTDNVGCREVVDDGENGFLVPVRDSRALASAIEKLAGDAALRASFGCISRAKAQNEFDENTVVERVIEHVYGLRHADVSLDRSSVPFGDAIPAMRTAPGRSDRIAG